MSFLGRGRWLGSLLNRHYFVCIDDMRWIREGRLVWFTKELMIYVLDVIRIEGQFMPTDATIMMYVSIAKMQPQL